MGQEWSFSVWWGGLRIGQQSQPVALHSEGCPEAPILPHISLCSVTRDRRGCPCRSQCRASQQSMPELMPCPSQKWSLSNTQYPAQNSCSCALGSSLVLRGQKKLCWCPLEEQQVPVWCTEPQPYGALSRIWDLCTCCTFCVILLADWFTEVISGNWKVSSILYCW